MPEKVGLRAAGHVQNHLRLKREVKLLAWQLKLDGEKQIRLLYFLLGFVFPLRLL